MTKQPILLYSHATGPNPWKVAIVLEELGIPYENKLMQFPDMKKEAYEQHNPNGRVPAIQDPNTGIVLFESGAIIEYLVDTYDTNHTITYSTFPEKYQLKSWLHFQMSGQGPYFGQLAWFTLFHSEKIPSAIERYTNEMKRVVGVIDRYLKEGKQYLVGDKCTYADLAFVTWDTMVPMLLGETVDLEKEFPDFWAWNKRVTERPSVKKALSDKAKAMEAQGH